MSGQSRRVLLAGVALFAWLTAACGGDAGAAASTTVRDSAGVHIVESSAPAWREGTEWTLSSTPELDIGVAEGDPHYQLDGVRDAVRLSDGRIVIANAGSGELRYYDATGRYLLTSGRKGKGPGEFGYLSGVQRLGGDTIAAFDVSPVRISVFDDTGHFVRAVTLSGSSGMFTTVVGRLPDGSWLQTAQMVLGHAPLHTGVRRDTTPWVRYAADGTVRDTIAHLPGDAVTVVMGQGSVGFGPRDFGRKTIAVVHGDRIYAGDNASYEIRVMSPTGALRRIIRRDRDNRPLTSNDVDAARRKRLAGITDENARRLVEQMSSSADLPESYPAYETLVVDARGNVWVKDYPRPTDTTATWAVFDPDGTLLGEVLMSADLTVFEIGTDYVLGRRNDDLDVQHVVLYRLRGATPPAASPPDPRSQPGAPEG